LVRSARIRADVRRIGASGNDTSVRYLQVPPVPPWRLDMLVKYEVEERSGERDAQTYDYRILDVPEVGGQYTVMIGALKESAANDILSMGRAAGLGEVQIDLEALALYSAYYHGHGFDPDKTVLIVDVGADDITILVVKNGSLYFGRTILGGGRRFTQVLSEELKIDPLEAEEIKKTQAEIIFDAIAAPTPGRTGRMVRPGLTGIIPRNPGLSAGKNPAAGTSATQTAPGDAAKPEAESKAPETLSLDPDSESMPASLEALDQAVASTVVQPPASTPPAPATLPGSSASAPAVATSAAPAAAAPATGSTMITPSPVAGVPLSPPTAIINMTSADDDKSPYAALRRKSPLVQRQISAALVKEAASLCAAIENAVMICRQQNKLREMKIDRMYITGGASKLKGLTEFMNRRMRIEVAPLEPLRQISLDRLPADQAAALKAEQHLLAVSLGLALQELDKRAVSFLLWPEGLKQRKIFWSRGAYLGYSAALVLLSMGLLLYTPARNRSALAENNDAAKKAVEFAQSENRALAQLTEQNKEKQQQYKQIHDNTNSGHYFLNLLSELKDPNRIPPDIYLTSISTTMPAVVRKTSENAGAQPADTTSKKPTNLREEMAKAARDNTEPNTFQAQRVVYIRGFARSGDKVKLLDRIEAFMNKLVPHYENPDHPANLFKDIRTVWWNPDDQQHGPYALKEFVLEAYTERTAVKTESTPAAPASGKSVVAGPDANNPKSPAVPVKAGGESAKPKFVLPGGQ
ncbi:MAG TPA: pilus assembly protein PilM, partial [Planctomycetota bacterium]|nr:pilus assembly protein PilM [Planctomycetota bacterium]